MKLRKYSIFLALVMILMTFAACGNGGTDQPDPSGTVSNSTTGDAPNEGTAGIQKGTSFKYWVNYDMPSHMPWKDSRGAALYNQLYDNLLYKYQMNQNDIRGNLAESWKVSDDGMVWVFQIKKDAYFTSGNQVNAEAFVKTWDITKEFQPRYFSAVKSYEATGEFELTITLNNPSATFIYDLPMQSLCGVVDPKAIEQYGSEDNKAAIGCGPYYIESYTSGKGFVLKANPNYHNPDKAPSIETCELVIIPDENTALIALMNGDLDCLNTVNIEVYNNLKQKGWDVLEVEDRVNPFWFNAREVEIFKNDAVREALCHMVDWEAASQLVYDGKYPASKSYWAGPGMVPYSDKYKYDPQLGLKILADAGFKPEDIKFTMLADPDFTNLEIAIQAQLNELGLVNVKTVTYDGATCYGMLKGGTYEMFPCHNGYGVESPLTPFSMGLTPQSTQRVMWLDYINKDRYAEAMKLYEAANTSATNEDYLKNVEALTSLVQDECLAMGGVQVYRFYAVAKNITGVHVAPITGYMDFCYLKVK
ncbi:ABC-type transport system substrate-binding protein [Anaerobacterium chartisolvens]|uniref:ABC-type transport system substrate-binding protein n=1 Tax=Anaerobacterium chartisolvens TaxID=1297424 RepID=A0A369B686_9FIRM|nr:ABC transporter substrate-binding protein [Anaerobacterium chartisolvens]RCX16056.1 ABC-type transport system substrate-binding protein [Anaerobacterium chartisolvens]